MGDSIEYCEQCDNRVGCHLARKCFLANDKANSPLDAASGSASWLGGKTCADAKRLREMIRKNGNAFLRTAPLVVEAIEDDDCKFALQELANVESQLRGLKVMLNHALNLKIALVGEEDYWPNAPGLAQAAQDSIQHDK